ncbi:hypothetical protein MPLA_1830318 [Mesorhizobium sp. ORS 3359]|nr:hypothetical protein MPLA_1830318 [Mesorhizobium sp. ORS 3359]
MRLPVDRPLEDQPGRTLVAYFVSGDKRCLAPKAFGKLIDGHHGPEFLVGGVIRRAVTRHSVHHRCVGPPRAEHPQNEAGHPDDRDGQQYRSSPLLTAAAGSREPLARLVCAPPTPRLIPRRARSAPLPEIPAICKFAVVSKWFAHVQAEP